MKKFKEILEAKSIMDVAGKEGSVEVTIQNEGHDFYRDAVTIEKGSVIPGDRKKLSSIVDTMKMLKKRLPQGSWSIAVEDNRWM